MNKPCTILLIDDNPAEILLFQEVYNEHRYEHRLIAMHTTDDVMNFLSRRGAPGVIIPDIIVLDLDMPGVTGLDVLRSVKGSTELAVIPVILFSSSDSVHDVHMGYRLHANCFIQKPADLHGLYSVVKRIMRFWFETVTLPSPRAEGDVSR
ncbi:MAG: response regulator [Spirochaetota bacterium]